MDISFFWESLTVLQKIHWIIALPATLIFIILLILTLVGNDSHDFNAGHDHDFSSGHDDGMHIFSLKSILAFLMFYGWTGLAVFQYGIGSWFVITIISLGIGLLMMLFTAWLFFMMMKLQASGTLDVNNAIGQNAEVYLTIPGKKKGSGQVQLIIQGTYRTLDAVTEEIEDIKTGAFVEVIDVINDTLVVRKKR
jgi:membrane protein implicated in regulation of membrane protease activity